MKSLQKYLLEAVIFLYLAVALSFVYQEHKALTCTMVDVAIVDGTGNFFVDEDEIVGAVNKTRINNPGNLMSDINIRSLEELIHKFPSIEKAEVFSSINGKLRVDITQRKPIVRVINYNGQSYYLDSHGSMMPLSTRYTARVPVATGYLNTPYLLNYNTEVDLPVDDKGRKAVLADLYKLSKFISDDEFYSALIEQIYVDNDNMFFLVPKMGPKIIEFGTVDDAEEKFFKLMAMYRAGMSLKGWDKYRKINVKYKNQVVCTK